MSFEFPYRALVDSQRSAQMPKDTSIKTSVSASSKTASKPTPVASSSSKPSKASSSKAQPPTASTDFDIDDIFAAPSTSAALQPPAATTAAKKKKKAKKPAAVKVEDKPVVEVSRVQTVVDPSIGVGKKIEPPAGGVGEMDGDMEAFRNSRGSGSESPGSALAKGRKGGNVELERWSELTSVFASLAPPRPQNPPEGRPRRGSRSTRRTNSESTTTREEVRLSCLFFLLVPFRSAHLVASRFDALHQTPICVLLTASAVSHFSKILVLFSVRPSFAAEHLPFLWSCFFCSPSLFHLDRLLDGISFIDVFL